MDRSSFAFPCTTGSDGGVWSCGMTLREYYAGQVMARFAGWGDGSTSSKRVAQRAAEAAVQHADALITELNKEATK